MSTYFVTGATGVVGSAITETLISRSAAQLKLLMRASSPDELRSRLENLFDFWGVKPDQVVGRVEALVGDATQPRFGLGAEDYARLTHECTHVVHSAGAVRMNLRLDDARRSAVDSAKHVIDFARACRDAGQLRKVEFLSTVGVGGRLPGSVPERWISEPRRFHNTYEQAKAEAELIVERAILNGLPITVHRPSMVVGNSTTGKVMHFQVFYYLIEFLSGQQTFGLFPNPGSTRLDVVPVDHVAEAVLWSSGCPDTSGKILHLCAGPDRALDLVDLRRLVRASFQDAGINLPRSTTVPASIFRAAIAVLRRVTYRPYRRTLGSVPIFLDYLAERQFFANYETAKRLQQAGISTPSPSAFLPTVIGYYLERRRTRHAA